MRHALLAIAITLPACSGDNNPAEMGCADIAAALSARAPSVSRACAAPSDCLTVGHPQASNGQPTCGGGVAFLSCPGIIAVNRVAWITDDEIAPLFEQWQTRCVPAGPSSGAPPGAYDCAPMGAACVAQQCEPAQFGCFGTGDAGVE